MNAIRKPKKPVPQDWHPADIVSALHKKGISLRQLSVDHGFAPNTLGNATKRPYPKAEAIIAKALGVKPETIWPSRYGKHRDPYRNWARSGIKDTSAKAARNDEVNGAA